VKTSGEGIFKKKGVFEGAFPAGILFYYPIIIDGHQRMKAWYHRDVEIPEADSCRSRYHDGFNSKTIHLSGSPFLRRMTFPVPDLAFDFSFLARDFS
jgi:hypothetical protein